ncbi:hypothetical protein [Hutsoniella sourekii]|uniref:hypothetical protein n=1 Tax=Hutsoniella sourekii TaxID=87650 RepID=UPI0004AFD331|nr:hypothetical protein [Hutsoniella sourekii]
MKYKNPYYKKIKNSRPLMIRCGACKKDLFKYQKIGVGNLKRMHLPRIIDSEINLQDPPQDLACPQCGHLMGHLVSLPNNLAYRMLKGHFNSVWIK